MEGHSHRAIRGAGHATIHDVSGMIDALDKILTTVMNQASDERSPEDTLALVSMYAYNALYSAGTSGFMWKDKHEETIV